MRCVAWFAPSAAALLVAMIYTAFAQAAEKPNVIVILVDDMGYADVGFNGCKDIPTPNIDRIAKEGIRFSEGYVSHPFCSPTRAGLMTGRYQQRFGHENNPKYDPHDESYGLPTDEILLPRVLNEAGYATGLVGKWHLGAHPQFHPMQRGFTEMYGFLGGGHDYFKTQLEGEPKEYLIPIHRDGKPEAFEGYLTDALSREAVAFVERHTKDPFFLYLAYNAPHTPLQAPEEYLNRFRSISNEKRRTYAAMVSAVDDGVGKLLAALNQAGLDERTLIFFFSDNGGPIGERSNGSDNTPLRQGKGSVYEGGFRVPFAMRWTGTLAAGKEYNHPVVSLDVFPTAAALAGAKLPEGRTIDGVNLMPYLLGKNQGRPHEVLFWRSGGGPTGAVRAGDQKLARPAGSDWQLYDLENDISETSDLAAEKPAVVAELQKQYEQWDAQLIQPVFEGLRDPRPGQKAKPAAGGKQAKKKAKQSAE
ncbi:MAG: sulfatase [Planctomycetota bacterium]